MPNTFSRLNHILLILFIFLIFSLNSAAVSSNDHILIMQNQDSQPKYFLQKRKSRGICGDIYIELQNRMANKGISIFIPGTYTPIKRIMQKLTAGDAHVFCGAGRNDDRDKKYHFSSVPLYSVSHVLMAHIDEKTKPQSFKQLVATNTPIGVYSGTSTEHFLKEKELLLSMEGYYELDRALLAVSNKELRYFYYHDLALNYYMKASSLPLQVLPTKFNTYSHWMMYSKSTPLNVRILLDEQIKDMVDSGKIEEILAKYKPN